MGTKRAYSDIHPSRRDQVTQPARKRQKPDNLGTKSFKKAHPVNDLKTRVRDLTRLLSRTDDKLPAHIRVAKERELQTTQHELDESRAAERKSKLIARYHKIRFFDRQKATKRLKKVQKSLQGLEPGSDIDKVEHLRKECEEYEVDINYAIYYPLDKPYSSLYPKDDALDDEQQLESGDVLTNTRKGDAAMRALVRECMRKNKLEDLRMGRLNGTEKQKLPTPQANIKASGKIGRPSKQGKSNAGKSKQSHADEDSDGGFFE